MRVKNASGPINPEGARSLEKIEKFVKLMDNQFQLPGTKFRFGLDPILGLIPFAGDAASLGLQSLMVVAMARHGASHKIVILMALNLVIDFVFGNIPIIGAIFDFWFKSSQKNFKLLKQHYSEGKHHGSGKGVLITILIVFILVIILIGWLMFLFFRWLFGLF